MPQQELSRQIDPPPEPAREEDPSAAPIEYLEDWPAPPFEPLKALRAFALTAAGFGLYEWVLLHFWSSESLGIHSRYPWQSYLLIAAAVVLSLAAIRTALSMQSPHAKLGFAVLAFLACAAIGFSSGRFISYTLRGTRNPPAEIRLATGQQFPAFTLSDQSDVAHQGPVSPDTKATLIYVYRGDFDAFARHEIADLNAIQPELQREGARVVAISADPVERSKMLSAYLRSTVPLLSDEHEALLGPLGLVQHHRDGEPDNAIPVVVVVDANGRVRWIFTSPFYRQLPTKDELIAAVQGVTNSSGR